MDLNKSFDVIIQYVLTNKGCEFGTRNTHFLSVFRKQMVHSLDYSIWVSYVFIALLLLCCYFTPNISKVLDLLNPIFTTCSRVDIDLFSIFPHFPIQGTSEGEILCFEMPSHGSEIKLVQSLQGKKLIQLNNFE